MLITDKHYPYDMVKELVDKSYGLEDYDIVAVWLQEDYGRQKKTRYMIIPAICLEAEARKQNKEEKK